MEIRIQVDEKTDEGKKLLKVLEDLGIEYSTNILNAKDVAFGIGRPSTRAEMEEYLTRCMNSELIDIEDIINED